MKGKRFGRLNHGDRALALALRIPVPKRTASYRSPALKKMPGFFVSRPRSQFLGSVSVTRG
jgi:hypothetical protein